jgi:hypothetical protein
MSGEDRRERDRWTRVRAWVVRDRSFALNRTTRISTSARDCYDGRSHTVMICVTASRTPTRNLLWRRSSHWFCSRLDVLQRTLDDASDKPTKYAEVVAEYVPKHTAEIIQENATTIGACLKGIVQRAKGRRKSDVLEFGPALTARPG